jgi:hypothetical protein
MLHIPKCISTGTTGLIPYLIRIKSVFLFHSFPTIPIYNKADTINVPLPSWFQPHKHSPTLTQQLELQSKYRQHFHSKFGEHSSSILFIVVTYVRRYLRKKIDRSTNSSPHNHHLALQPWISYHSSLARQLPWH